MPRREAKTMPQRGSRLPLFAIVAALSAALLLSACGPSSINTVGELQFDDEAIILDTPTNRDVLDVLNAYHKAIEAKDSERLKSLVSDDYYENGGTSERTDDDYGNSGVSDALRRFTESIEHIQFEIVVKDLRVEGDHAQVFYEYSYNYLFRVDEVPRWEAGRDVNRMDLVLNESGKWKITRGL